MKADVPDSALGTPRWSRLNRLEDMLLRVVAQADLLENKPNKQLQ